MSFMASVMGWMDGFVIYRIGAAVIGQKMDERKMVTFE